MKRIIESRNKREGGYAGRRRYDRQIGLLKSLGHRRAGRGDGFTLVTLREWSRA